ncbi:hypothetical protein SADUNF_Sadunf16G0049000 [Salix dunnii]|uniref:Uncharacterized protein n=1 Tax=Salix dunnii TaxID=1413687 RepID=A0A835JCG1_9ROSI|nr:hypothetical protein SADUNF_Sadunf16G0049000 [Salix dunnii]
MTKSPTGKLKKLYMMFGINILEISLQTLLVLNVLLRSWILLMLTSKVFLMKRTGLSVFTSVHSRKGKGSTIQFL